MKTEATVLQPLVKNVTVPLDRVAAFRRFTEGIADWWPMETHSVGEGAAESVTLEPRVGGRFFETQRDGSTSEWGRVTAWDPSIRVAFTWHPGRAAETAQNVEVEFREVEGGTEVQLTHHNWETHGDQAVEMRATYSTGWEGVLALFADT